MLVMSFEYPTSPLIEPEEFLTLSSVAVVVAARRTDPDEASTSTEGEAIDERRVVLPLELVILIDLSTTCSLDSLKAIPPLCVATVSVRASTLCTVIDEESVFRTTSLAFSTVSINMGRLSVLISRSPMLGGRDMATSIKSRGAVAYESRESPPVEIEISLPCW